MAIKIIKPGKFKNPYNETEYWASCPICHYSTCRSELLKKEVSNGN